jgi:hypothetical protein
VILVLHDLMSKPVDATTGRWTDYPETVLKFAIDPEISVDLRTPVDPPARKALRAIGLDGEFAVLTAYNPGGENVDEEENRSRLSELENELRSAGEKFISVDACSPDESHCECGVAIMTTRERAIAIAERFEQIAIFWFDGDHFWIVGVLTPAAPMRLPFGE